VSDYTNFVGFLNLHLIPKSSVHNKHDVARHRLFQRDADHIGVILVKNMWTQDIGDHIGSVVILSERPLNSAEAGMSMGDRDQFIRALIVSSLHSWNRGRLAYNHAPEIEQVCRRPALAAL